MEGDEVVVVVAVGVVAVDGEVVVGEGTALAVVDGANVDVVIDTSDKCDDVVGVAVVEVVAVVVVVAAAVVIVVVMIDDGGEAVVDVELDNVVDVVGDIEEAEVVVFGAVVVLFGAVVVVDTVVVFVGIGLKRPIT